MEEEDGGSAQWTGRASETYTCPWRRHFGPSATWRGHPSNDSREQLSVNREEFRRAQQARQYGSRVKQFAIQGFSFSFFLSCFFFFSSLLFLFKVPVQHGIAKREK
jgi:hypothetical protein